MISPISKDYPAKPKTKDQKILELTCIKIPNNASAKIKRLYLLYDPDVTLDDRQKGISIQRGGMSVCRYKMDDLGSLSDYITGYVTVEEDFEDLLRDSEGIEHYSYNWGTVPAKDLKLLLVQKYKEWAKKELGWRDQQTVKTTKDQLCCLAAE